MSNEDVGAAVFGLRAAVRRHPATAYAVLVFALTWSVWIPRTLGSQDLLTRSMADGRGRVLGLRSGLGRGDHRGVDRARSPARPRISTHRLGRASGGVCHRPPRTGGLLGRRLPDRTPARLVRPAAPAGAPHRGFGRNSGDPPAALSTAGLGEGLGWRAFLLAGSSSTWTGWRPVCLPGVIWAVWHLSLYWTEGAALVGGSPLVMIAELPAHRGDLHLGLRTHQRKRSPRDHPACRERVGVQRRLRCCRDLAVHHAPADQQVAPRRGDHLRRIASRSCSRSRSTRQRRRRRERYTPPPSPVIATSPPMKITSPSKEQP